MKILLYPNLIDSIIKGEFWKYI